MDKELKDLLLKDLCARLPYGVKVAEISGNTTNGVYEVKVVNKETKVIGFNTPTCLIRCYRNMEMIKPYLRPMSDMTEEEFERLKEYSGLKYEQLDLASYQNATYKCLDFYLSEVPSYVVILVFDWLNTHHFDYRGLIERGLAIEVTKENNPYKK